MRCNTCGNRDPRKFGADYDVGESICGSCGTVTQLTQDNPFIRSEKLGSFINWGSCGSSELVASLKRVERTCIGPSNTATETLIAELSEKANIPEGVKNSVLEYSKTHGIGGRGMRRKEAIAALLFIFSKKDPRVNKTLNEICEATSTNRQRVGRYLIQLTLDNGLTLEQRTPEHYLRKYGGTLKLSDHMIERTVELI